LQITGRYVHDALSMAKLDDRGDRVSDLSSEEFVERLIKEPLARVVQQYIFEGTPFAFRDAPDTLTLLESHLGAALGIQRNDIKLVGSAKMGFSLNPDNFPRRFGDESDLDVVIVSERLFDLVWHTVLKWNYPRRPPNRLPSPDSRWARDRRRELYWGWFLPDKIGYEGLSLPDVLVPIRDLSTTWFNAFRSLAQYPELAAREVSGRLYRTWDLAFLYHLDGLEKLRAVAAQMRAEG